MLRRDGAQHKVCRKEQRLYSSVPMSDYLLEGYQVLQILFNTVVLYAAVREFVNCFWKENTLLVLK